jgi:hypothetical protein
MPVYRYKFVGADDVKLNRELPGAATLTDIGIITYLDVTTLVTVKDDLDVALAVRGYVYESTDPLTTPIEQSASVIDHGDLLGLLNDDHPLYLLIDGTRAMTGDLNMGGSDINNVGLIDGVDIEDHSARHEDGGADEVNVTNLSGVLADAQKVTIRTNTGANVGTRPRLNFISGALIAVTATDDGVDNEVDITIGATMVDERVKISANDTTSDYLFPKTDAGDGIVLTELNDGGYEQLGIAADFGGAPPAVAAASSGGAATTVSRSDHTHQGITDIGGNTGSVGYGVVGDVSQIDIGDTASAGVSAAISRADHQHALPAGVAPPVVAAASAAGVATTPARSDHTHGGITDIGGNTGSIGYGVVGDVTQIDVGDAASAGVSAAISRADHQHALPAPAAPADVTKAAASAGASTTVARADHKHDISTAIAGTILPDDTAAEGTATSLARSDHRHAITAAAPTATGVATASAEGTATSFARSDHAHQSNTAPVDVTKAAAAIGTSGEPARADHKHDVSTAAPVTIGTANSEGAATSLARSNHVHDHGAQALGTGTQHALATTLVAGFMSPADKALSTTLAVCNRFFPPTSNAITDIGNYATVSIGANATLNISFEFPDDYSSLVELVIVGIPVLNFFLQNIDFFSNYAAVGELYSANAQSDITSTYSGTADTLLEFSIASLYTSAVAGDYAGIKIDHNAIGTAIGYLGIRMRYTRV